MLTREILLQIASDTCPGCQRPLGVHHAYPVTDSETLLTMLTDHPPRCLTCATEIAEAQPEPKDGRPHLAVVIVVKVSSISMPSGRLLKLHPEDPTTWRIHLDTPKDIHFRHVTNHEESRAQMIRPATNEEAEAWLTPALEHLSATLAPDTEPHRELITQIARLQRHLPPRPPTSTISNQHSSIE
jgi:hypothetical protein